MISLPVGLRGAVVGLMSRCVTPTPERFGPGARDFWVNFGNNVDEGFGAVILPDGADRLADVIVIRMGKS